MLRSWWDLRRQYKYLEHWFDFSAYNGQEIHELE
jgi:hypothetical protein